MSIGIDRRDGTPREVHPTNTAANAIDRIIVDHAHHPGTGIHRTGLSITNATPTLARNLHRAFLSNLPLGSAQIHKTKIAAGPHFRIIFTPPGLMLSRNKC